uniref:Protein kinase domain-containing protein n=1 Tax=Knipowitschia caucasica TaxID=637954 RepID=A0AAV2MEZ0_KNICA
MFRPSDLTQTLLWSRSCLPMAHSTKTIAKGCFGKVYKEKYGDKWAAIKRVPMGLINMKDLERECAVYKKAEHLNIVKLLGPVTCKDGKYVIPLEFIDGEDLEMTIFNVSKSKVPSTSSAKTTIILGMCEGLLHLHRLDIVHQDLKPDNIMVEHGTNRAVIIDLGLAKFFKNGLNSAMDMGNEAYSAPEVLRISSQRDQRSDVWAMGKIIAELCARVRLVTTSVNPEKIKEFLKDSPYCSTVCRMVQPDPSLRATMAGVIGDIRTKAVTSGAGAHRFVPPANPTRGRHLMPSNPVPAREHSPRPQPSGGFAEEGLLTVVTPGAQLTPKLMKMKLHDEPKKDLLPVVQSRGKRYGQDMVKTKLFEAATRDLPFDVPAHGRVVVQSFEEKDGEVEHWQQKELVMRDGRIVKFNNVELNK